MRDRLYILPGTPDSRRAWMACSYHHRTSIRSRICAAIELHDLPAQIGDDAMRDCLRDIAHEVMIALRWRSIYVGKVPVFDDGERLIVKGAIDYVAHHLPDGSRHEKARECLAAARDYLIDLGLAGVEPPPARACGDRCPRCDGDSWRMSATLIECALCETQWGRVNRLWLEVPSEHTRRCSRCGCVLSDHDAMEPHGCTACECTGWEED